MFAFAPDSNNDLVSTLANAPVATLPTAYYQNPSFLSNAAPPGGLQFVAQTSTSVQTTDIAASITGNTLTVTYHLTDPMVGKIDVSSVYHRG